MDTFFVPCRNLAFLVPKALHKFDFETDFHKALKESVVDFSTISKSSNINYNK